jgi:hypothetical protein
MTEVVPSDNFNFMVRNLRLGAVAKRESWPRGPRPEQVTSRFILLCSVPAMGRAMLLESVMEDETFKTYIPTDEDKQAEDWVCMTPPTVAEVMAAAKKEASHEQG